MRMLLVFILLLPLSVHSRIFGVPSISSTTLLGSDGISISYLARFGVNTSTIGNEAAPSASFLVDTNAQRVSFSSSSCRSRAGLWSLVAGDSGVVASTADSFLGNVVVLCGKNAQNVAALGSKSTSLPAQLSKVGQIPLRFAYILRNSGAQLLFGKTVWIQYTQYAPPVTVPVVFAVQAPLKLDDKVWSYMVKLTGIGFKSVLTGQSEYVGISTTQRFTTLPSKIYSFVVGQFQQEAKEKKINKVDTSAFNGKLALCYQVTSSVIKGFRNVTMAFEGKSQWSVPGDKYMVAKPGANNVFCIAFLEALGNASGVIGTLQQEDRAVEFNLQNKTLGVSLPLVGGLISP